MADGRTPPKRAKATRALARPRLSHAPARVQNVSTSSEQSLISPIRLGADEAVAIVVAFALFSEEEHAEHADAARAALAKIVAASSRSVRTRLAAASAAYRPPRPVEDWEELAGLVREAIRDERELRIVYSDREGEDTVRIIRPLAWAESRRGESVAAWCKLRKDFRNFRLDRIIGIAALEAYFKGERDALLERYMRINRP